MHRGLIVMVLHSSSIKLYEIVNYNALTSLARILLYKSRRSGSKMRKEVWIADLFGVHSDTSTELCLRGNEVGGKV